MELIFTPEELDNLLDKVMLSVFSIYTRNREQPKVSEYGFAIDQLTKLTKKVTPYLLQLHWYQNTACNNANSYAECHEHMKSEIENTIDMDIICYTGMFYKQKPEHMYRIMGFGLYPRTHSEFSKGKMLSLFENHTAIPETVFDKVMCANVPADEWVDGKLIEAMEAIKLFDLKPIEELVERLEKLREFNVSIKLDEESINLIKGVLDEIDH